MKKLLVLILLAGTSMFGQFNIGIRIGAPPAPRVLRSRPNSPGPGYTWVDGYWYPVNNRYVWHAGYYTRPPNVGATWVTPRYESQQYYQGYWSSGDRQIQHDHGWDHNRNSRDYDHYDNNGNRR